MMNRLGIFTASVLTCLVLATAGCGQPEISPAAYEYASTLFFVCNQKLDDRLPKIQKQIDDAVASGELTSTDADALGNIIDKASSGDWTSANRTCRALMDAQVKRVE